MSRSLRILGDLEQKRLAPYERILALRRFSLPSPVPRPAGVRVGSRRFHACCAGIGRDSRYQIDVLFRFNVHARRLERKLLDRTLDPEGFANSGSGDFVKKLGITIAEWTLDRVVGTMPVDGNEQADGYLAAGAMMSLAETVASIGGAGVVGWPDRTVVGQQQSFNLVSAPKHGHVQAVAVPIHVGGTTHVWNVKITLTTTNELAAVARVTLAVRDRRARRSPEKKQPH